MNHVLVHEEIRWILPWKFTYGFVSPQAQVLIDYFEFSKRERIQNRNMEYLARYAYDEYCTTCKRYVTESSREIILRHGVGRESL